MKDTICCLILVALLISTSIIGGWCMLADGISLNDYLRVIWTR